MRSSPSRGGGGSRRAQGRAGAAGLALLAIVLWAASGAAQTLQTGTLVGKVTDHTGASAPGVTVTLTSPVLLAPRTAVTDAEGSYRFAALPPGSYALSFELQGFRRLTRSNVLVDVGATRTVDATIEVGAVTESIEVVGETAAVDVTQTNVATNLDTHALQQIPTSRDVWAILQNMAPQVVLDREDVGGDQGGLQAVFSSHGSTWRQNTYALNGVNVTDPAATGAAGFYYDYDSFEQVQISTAQHAAEVGTPGVYYNFVAKRGTEAFHGGAAYYFENDGLVSDNITQALRDQGITSGAGIDLFSDATVQLGGPLIKDKLRFFTSWRDWRIHRKVPNFPKSENTDLFSGLLNLSYQLDDRNRLDVLGTYQTYWKPNRNASAQVQPDSTWIEDDVFRIFQAHYNSQIKSNALLDVRLSYSNVDFPLKFQPGVTRQNSTELTTGDQTGVAQLGFVFYRSRLAGDATLSYYKGQWLGADHDMKLGYQFGRAFSESDTQVRDGVTLNTFEGQPSFLIAWNTPVVTQSKYIDHVLYVQDNVTKGRFAFNVGLRYQHTSGVLPAQSSPAGPFAPARSFPEQDVIGWDDLAARAGFVWDIRGDHKALFKVGYGRYYHQLSPDPIEAPSQNASGGTGYGWNDLNGDLQYQTGELGDVLFTFGGSSITTVDGSLKRPRTDEVTAGVEFLLPRNVTLNVDGIFRWGSKLLATTEIGIPFDAGYTPATAIDPGPDGATGAGDDRTVQVFNLRPEYAGQNRLFVTNPAGFETSFKGLEVTLQRRFANRWQGLLGYSLSKDDLSRAGTSLGPFGGGEEESAGLGSGSAFLNPNQTINNDAGPSFFDRRHSFKLFGSYQVPKIDVNVGGVLKFQTGVPYARVVTLSTDVNGVAFNQGPITIFAEPRDQRRVETLTYMDFRLSKFFNFGRERSRNLEVILDVFNLFNENKVTAVNSNTGSAFENAISILGPRVLRIGARFTF
jgi:hypothetical protein